MKKYISLFQNILLVSNCEYVTRRYLPPNLFVDDKVVCCCKDACERTHFFLLCLFGLHKSLFFYLVKSAYLQYFPASV